MTNDSLSDRYFDLIDHIVDITLQGKIRSKTQVYNLLVQGINKGTGEIFERCLEERFKTTQAQLDIKVKASRILRALETIQGEWERWQQENKVTAVIVSAIAEILTAQPSDRLTILLRIIDPNQTEVLTLEQLKLLATALKQTAEFQTDPNLAQFARGITNGLDSWQQLEGDLVSWIYEQDRETLGFGLSSDYQGPWILWSKKVNSPLLIELFQTIASHQSLVEFAAHQKSIEPAAWIELAVVLQSLQRGLIQFFDQQIYSTKSSAKLSISTFLTFANIWSQLANGLNQIDNYQAYGSACFKISLQILRVFSQREYFPLYGGVYASFSGKYLREALTYLSEPLLRQVEGTQEMARVVTLLGYTFQVQNYYEQAIAFHEEALDIARLADDKACEVANLNHLSRIYTKLKNYTEAVNYSQRALILSRQYGNSLGQANALANLGYSEVLQAQQLEQIEAEVYERAINYLEQGLALLEKLEDRQSQSLCYSSLGITYVILEQPQAAIDTLLKGLEASQASGDLYLQGLTLAYLSEAYYQTSRISKAIYSACMGIYFLEEVGANEWRKPAGLLTILQGQQGEKFNKLFYEDLKEEIIAVLKENGYKRLLELLAQYKESI